MVCVSHYSWTYVAVTGRFHAINDLYFQHDALVMMDLLAVEIFVDKNR